MNFRSHKYESSEMTWLDTQKNTNQEIGDLREKIF